MTRVAPHRVDDLSGNVRSHRAVRHWRRPFAVVAGTILVAALAVAVTLLTPGDPQPRLESAVLGNAPDGAPATTLAPAESGASTTSAAPAPTTVTATPPGAVVTPAPGATTATGGSTRSNPTTGTPAAAAGSTIQVYLTGYGFRDNDCGSGAGGDCTSAGDGHAGGTGTYADPITLAVGSGGWAPGTRAYLPELQRYVVVEDRCASCGAGHGGLTWVDIWVDGRSLSATAAEQCMNALTGVTTAQLNPPAGLPVRAGTIGGAAGCQL